MNYKVEVSTIDLKNTMTYHMKDVECVIVQEGFVWFKKKTGNAEAIKADLIISITLE